MEKRGQIKVGLTPPEKGKTVREKRACVLEEHAAKRLADRLAAKLK